MGPSDRRYTCPPPEMDHTPPTATPLAESETLLFVYGTLKSGQPNHGRLQGARCLGQASLPGACLHDLGPFPMAVAGEGSVAGELYAVAWTDLPDLDAFEGCPRLYQRHWLPLADGRQAWAYLGQARQVRHVPRLAGGLWLGVGTTASWAVLWLLQPLALSAGAFDSLATCQAWRSSHGLARLELANAIGAAHYLTKRHAFQESTPEAPVELYSPSDIQRVCGRS
ncbi:MAG: gamma-glutamylcyclotransferase [Cyanobium sp.]